MDSTDSKPSEVGEAVVQKRPRRWFQFRLRTLLLLVGLCAVALWRTLADALPYREQWRTMALVQQLGGSYQTSKASNWHRQLFGSDLQNLVTVNLADCDAADDYIGPLAGSPMLETLVVGGEAFGDEHLRRLQGTASLRYLVLDSTAVTDEAIAALRAAQPKVEVYTSERRGIAALQNLGYVSTRPVPVPPPLQSHLPKDFFDTCHTGCFSQKCGDGNLAPVRRLRTVQRLVLSHCTITDVSLSYFRGLKELRELHLGGNRITDAGLAHLKDLAKLRELQLEETPNRRGCGAPQGPERPSFPRSFLHPNHRRWARAPQGIDATGRPRTRRHPRLRSRREGPSEGAAEVRHRPSRPEATAVSMRSLSKLQRSSRPARRASEGEAPRKADGDSPSLARRASVSHGSESDLNLTTSVPRAENPEQDLADSTLSALGGVVARRAPRRWLQFRLRTLLLLVGLCAVFLWCILTEARPYREQRGTMALVAELGGTYQTAEASSWHRRLFGSDLQNLVVVNLADCDAVDDYIGPVAGSPMLETLLVGGEAFGDQHIRQLQGTASLRHLVLDSTAVTEKAIAALRAAQPKAEIYASERRAIAALRGLGPTSTRARPVPPPLEAVVPEHYFDTFETGCFSNKCGDAQLASIRHFKHVRRLVMGHSKMTDLGLSHFSDLRSLRVLYLGRARITDAGLAHLAGLANLEELTLNSTPITDAGLAHLKGLTNLRSLDLGKTRVTDAGLVHIKGLTKLTVLYLDDTRLTEAAVQDLQKALPTCHITHRASTR